MILILEQYQDHFCKKLEEFIKEKGLAVLRLTPTDIVYKLDISFHLNESECFSEMAYDSIKFSTNDLTGIYSELDAFWPEYWNFFSQKDAEYAAMEWQSFWYSVISSLHCPIINPPAMDTLGGTFLSPVELFYLASQVGLEIPTIIEVESGWVASELSEKSINLTYTDLGSDHHKEMPVHKETLLLHSTLNHHIRLREYIHGTAMNIALVGKKPFVSQWIEQEKRFKATSFSDVPKEIIEKLLSIHNVLNLKVADYRFSVMPDQNWIFIDVQRKLTEETLNVYEDIMIPNIVDFFLEKEN